LIRADSSVSWHNRCAVFVAAPRSAPSLLASVLGATDPGSSRLVYAMVIGLVVIGIALVVLAVWLIRQTRPDLEVLAPLERMGDRDWKKRDPATQRRMLDELRPDGAEPLSAQAPPPPVDDDFERPDHAVPSLSDLGPGVDSGPSPTPSGGLANDLILSDGPDTAESGPDDAEEGVVVADSDSDADDAADLAAEDAAELAATDDAADDAARAHDGDEVEAPASADADDGETDAVGDDTDAAGDETSDEVGDEIEPADELIADDADGADDSETVDDVAADQR
jgi:hypothetical protein